MNTRAYLKVTAITFFLSFQTHSLFSQEPRGAKMECKLTVQKANLSFGEICQGEVAIKNTGKHDIVITYNANPWEFLDLDVTNPAGKKISDGKYGGRFSPLSPKAQQQIVLKPGETYRGAVEVFGNSKENDRTTPGAYKVTAVFEYNKLRAIADPVVINIGSK